MARIDARPGTPEFMRLYNEAVAQRKPTHEGKFMSLCTKFKASSNYIGLSPDSKRAYTSYLKLIED